MHDNFIYRITWKNQCIVWLFAGIWLTSCSGATELPPQSKPLSNVTFTPTSEASAQIIRKVTESPASPKNTALKPTETPFPRPTQSPDEFFLELSKNWKVAYYDAPSSQICAMHGDGSDKSCLELNHDNFPDGYASRKFLSWSPDGSRLVTVSECNFYVWEPGDEFASIRDGKVCGIYREPKWSPDGKYLAYVSEEFQRTCPNCQSYYSDIFVDSLAGTIHRSITSDFVGWSSDLAWSPEGERITFTSNVVTEFKNDGPYRKNSDIFMFSFDQNSVTNLTNHPAIDEKAEWSPDGKLIAFFSDRDSMYGLFVMNSDGSAVRKITTIPSTRYRQTLTWLPEGKHVLYGGDILIDLETGDIAGLHFPFDVTYADWFFPTDN